MDGKILVAGSTTTALGNTDLLVIRYNQDGGLDGTFGGNGKRVIPLSSENDGAYSVTALPKGKILIASYASNGVSSDWAVVQLNSNGSLDTGFNGNGKVFLSIGSGNDNAYSLLWQSSGVFYVMGSTASGSLHNVAMAKFQSTGQLDTTFGTGGKRIASLQSSDGTKFGFAQQADGRLLVAGSRGGSAARDVELLRFTATGSLDRTFDGDGRVQLSLGGADEVAYFIAVQPDQKILVSGYDNEPGTKAEALLLRFDSNGGLDSSFSRDGVLRAALSAHDDIGFQVGVQKDGRILLVGQTKPSGSGNFFVSRYLGDPPVISGTPSAQFTSDGAAILAFENISVVNPYSETLTLEIVIENGLERGDFDPQTTVGWRRFQEGNSFVYTKTVNSASSGITATQALRRLAFRPRTNAVDNEETFFTINVMDAGGWTVTNTETISVVNLRT